ncbi:bifunctional diaminohydroxyphosphoribosylaminopyrimidine deaminase/5-amino-6-(5-phosphoribosylamino)uracil reductase RibD [Sulfurovum sp. XGS-02]|uniref:bifunctional diaminohydroxyphosphoribosylaminopyrimidine deaminase/5-amino-6-(5-phosphoribosylamino)uracil reductase RibD n=1 Tax=Sulfurovum sp. XGS-02 TaxID=2925411 RepID=UPI00204E1AB8|nr:bifunctional diaminohydroxyphosphoribosylaminopyrimidine deaminase/5-amino-6-(5-phosphoribosylamino)uracil reductase RibD [Sulfurovum sp. XGS-02]UPT77211.1 bifunctional diaminohydroxyphosphoribosylaminopyrimidine deaminase/5-amino-6-(5-phosphoribosylamino)uracil reductase RibD [Sulfurovum sp. XGS-02]
MRDEFYMQLALDKAWEYQGLTYPNPAVGAVVMLEDKILSIEAHQKAGTSHAEVLALLSAYETLTNRSIDFDPYDSRKAHDFLLALPKDFFSDCTIYVTLEPCSHTGKTPSCASLLQSLALHRVVIGTDDPIEGHGGGMKQLGNVSVGILKKECQALIEPFMIWQNRAFVLFKLAQTTNGRIGGGYLSSKASLTHVHQLREVCDTLLIGGNTVREDRPTLDCRFIQAEAPNVKIYAKEDNFDREIPLFSVEKRSVEIINRLDFLERPSFVLVEGGEGMLKAIHEKIDWMLIYQTPKLSTNNLTYNTTMNLHFLHQDKKEKDLMIWSKHIGH